MSGGEVDPWVAQHQPDTESVADGGRVSLSIRPEKIWLSDFEPGMALVNGVVRETVYSGTTQPNWAPYRRC
ncbi:hypothetical protein ACIPXV_09080 [Streptomyces libani]|uniref:hypothetical protein n=1 Tax=Streptomyces nigrescens TaxID=1920 RepID=UPI00380F216C